MDISTRHEAALSLVRNRGKRVLSLAHEVCNWLESLDATDLDRLDAIEQAKPLLDKAPLNEDGTLDFQFHRVAMQVGDILRPSRFCPEERVFGKAVGRWLTTWIHFWIYDPQIWNEALDLAYEHLGARVQAA